MIRVFLKYRLIQVTHWFLVYWVYYSEIMVVPGINQKVNGSVYMNPQYFEFKEVKVFAFKEYEVFKEKFLELDLTNSEIARVQKTIIY
jgi:hypothetical protein